MYEIYECNVVAYLCYFVGAFNSRFDFFYIEER